MCVKCWRVSDLYSKLIKEAHIKRLVINHILFFISFLLHEFYYINFLTSKTTYQFFACKLYYIALDELIILIRTKKKEVEIFFFIFSIYSFIRSLSEKNGECLIDLCY